MVMITTIIIIIISIQAVNVVVVVVAAVVVVDWHVITRLKAVKKLLEMLAIRIIIKGIIVHGENK